MEKGYEEFVEALRRALLKETGYEEKRIYFKKKEDYPPTAGDRLFIECINLDETCEVCALYVRDLYERYKEGETIGEIVEEAVLDVKKMMDSGFFEKVLHLSDYQKVKDDLFIRLLNLDRHRKDLENAVYRKIGDIALVLYMKMGEMDHCITSVKIQKKMLDNWDIDEQEVFDDALLNTYYLSPPRIFLWEKLLFDPDYDGENFMDILSDPRLKRDSMGNCLSTTKRTNGAVAVFLPGVAARLGDLLGESFYMVFTSIHEVMIHSDRFVEPEILRGILKDTVREATPEKDFLSLYIYHYDRETGIITYE